MVVNNKKAHLLIANGLSIKGEVSCKGRIARATPSNLQGEVSSTFETKN